MTEFIDLPNAVFISYNRDNGLDDPNNLYHLVDSPEFKEWLIGKIGEDGLNKVYGTLFEDERNNFGELEDDLKKFFMRRIMEFGICLYYSRLEEQDIEYNKMTLVF